jgi:hypothetical protein
MADLTSLILDTIDAYVTTFTAGDRDAWLNCFTP